MPPTWMVSRTGKATQQLIAEESASRAARRRERLEEIDRFARAFALESRRDDIDVQLRPLRYITRAEDEIAGGETVKLRRELEGNGIRISLDDAREITPDERAVIAEVHSRLRSGWSNAPIVPEREKTTDEDQPDDGAEAVAKEVSLFLGAPISASDVRRSHASKKKFQEMAKEKNKKRLLVEWRGRLKEADEHYKRRADHMTSDTQPAGWPRVL